MPPFDKSLGIFNEGQLVALNDLPGMENFSEVAKAAWSTDDGKTTFAVPMASVIHGFFYNKAIFKELGLSVPGTEKEFLAVLQKIKANGKYIPLVMGTKDQWESATMGYQNIGPTLWDGETGRKALINGTPSITTAVSWLPLKPWQSGNPIFRLVIKRWPIRIRKTSLPKDAERFTRPVPGISACSVR